MVTQSDEDSHSGTGPARRSAWRRRSSWTAIALTVTLAGCGGKAPATQASAGDPGAWVVDTPKAAGPLDTATWNLVLEPAKLDPAESGGYGESTVLANMCESLQVLKPDFSIADGLARFQASPDRKTLTYTIDAAAHFWDGKPVTGADAAYSLTRVWKPTGRPYWSAYFTNVTSIAATGDKVVTIALRQPDQLLEKILSTAAGAVVEKAYSEAHPDFGTSSVPPMCSGPYRFVAWKSGATLTIQRTEDYWRGVTAKVRTLTFNFLQGDAAQTTALTGDAIQGMYQAPYSGLKQLAQHGDVYYGKCLLTFYAIPTRKQGPLQDARVRKALFMALNRKALADAVFAGSAVPSRGVIPRSGYGDVVPTLSDGTGGSEAELAAARQLVKDAGAPTSPIVLVGNPGISDSIPQTLQAIAEAGKSIGLNVQYKSVTLGQYYALFGTPNGWKEVDADAFGSLYNLPVPDPQSQSRIWADPADSENYGGFSDPQVTKLVNQAAAQTDAKQRADLLGQADKLLFDQMPWIPTVDVSNILYLNKKITGPPASFVYWWYPWAADLGAR